MGVSIHGLASDLSILDSDAEIDPQDKADLLRYLNEARCMISSLNPAYYAEIKTLKLGAGGIHKVCDCEIITKVLGQVEDACDTAIRSDKFPQNWGAACSAVTATGVVLTQILPDQNYLRVSPNIPEGETAYVMVKCLPADLPAASDETNIGKCRDAAALSAYAMYRVSLRDSDGDAGMVQLAQMHLRTFAELSGLQYKATIKALEDASATDTGA